MSSPVTFTVTPYLSGDPAFVAWAGGISAALDSAGLARQADTGAVTSWGAQTRPTPGTAPYFEIRKLATPATGACPVYIKFSYGTNNGSTVYPMLLVSTGTGTDGAGNLTGPGSGVAPISVVPAGADNAPRTCYATYDGDGFVLSHSLEAAATRFLVVVDRQRRPADGVAAPYTGFPNTGYMRTEYGASSGTASIFVDSVTGAVSLQRAHPAVIPRTVTLTTTMVNAAGKTTFLPYIIATRQGTYFSKMLLACPIADTQTGMDMPISFLGATRTYRALGSLWGGTDALANPGMGCAFWWSD